MLPDTLQRRPGFERSTDFNNSRKLDDRALCHVLGMRFHVLLLKHQHLVFQAKL